MDSDDTPAWAKGQPTGNEFPFPSLDFPDHTAPRAQEIAARLSIGIGEIRALDDAGQVWTVGDDSSPFEARGIAVECYRDLVRRRITGPFDARNGVIPRYQARDLFKRLSDALHIEILRLESPGSDSFTFQQLNCAGRSALTLSQIEETLDCFDIRRLVELIESAQLVAVELSPSRTDRPIYRVPVEAYRCFVAACWTSPLLGEYRSKLKPEVARICHRELGEFLGAVWRQRSAS